MAAHFSCFLVLGPAGSGLTTALNAFNDFGYLQVGEIPPAELENIVASLSKGHPQLAISVVVPESADTERFAKTVQSLKQQYPGFKVLILDAPEPTLVQRYQSSGKPHRLESKGCKGVQQSVAEEKKAFNPLKSLKDYSIDTSTTDKTELRNKIAKVLGVSATEQSLTIYITSFGFKYGIPLDAELVFDMRFFKNPFYEEHLREQTGLDKPVQDYIFAQPVARPFFDQWLNLVSLTLPRYQEEGKTRLSIALGCTGGKHRSVCMAHFLGESLKTKFPSYNVIVSHREVFRWGSQIPGGSAAPSSASKGEINVP